MVYQHSIPFGAPSQFRLQMTVGADGNADLAVLDAFNQPIGNLNHLRAPFAEISQLMQPGSPDVTAAGPHALIKLARTTDPEWLAVHYSDEESFIERDTTVMIEELQSLISDAGAYLT